MPTLVQLAKQMQDMFTVGTYSDGTSIWTLRNEAPQWMTDVMHAVHDDGASLPDDTVYDLAHDCVNAVAELYDHADADEAREALDEIEPEFRTWQLYTWAARWSEYIDELTSDFGEATIKSSTDVFTMFQAAQALHIRHVGELLVEALDNRAEDDEDDETEDLV